MLAGGQEVERSVGRSVNVEAVTKSFGAVTAISDVSLAVKPGEFLTLLGPSGCGKTTLMRMIAGFEFPTRGKISFDDNDVTYLPPEARPSNMVFQRYALFPHLSVAENIAYGLLAKGLPKTEVKRKIGAALDLVHMAEFSDRHVRQLSGGQAQRVALARAIVNEPKVLLLDEPLSALDLQLRNHMQVELRSIHRQLGTTFLFVTHDQGEALAMSTRIAVMNRGNIEQLGTPAEIYHTPANRFVAGFVGESSFVSGRIKLVESGRAVVQLSDSAVARVSARRGVEPGSMVSLMLRPEMTKLVAIGAGRFKGRLQDVIFTGAFYRIHVKLNDGTTLKLDSASAPDSELGSEVDVDWTDEAAVMVEAS